ncbi:D-alanyl-D-alanine carboxypeptidase family protein [Clostridium tarantellae]|uniref:serine-type D-Ala-D-Ala carboxypeptidase n=1 Tax=Clostridium tarantellae TaxID=39493 RepID=A0A6I1MHW8_9CLOT|nr:D-alanyl-D-alanine carboxypeptidase family protein [Clostridium tarantellae]MPQ42474.1 D-alanyl-D-alanine carboxypeptidase [Clostridium tarantellae]
MKISNKILVSFIIIFIILLPTKKIYANEFNMISTPNNIETSGKGMLLMDVDSGLILACKNPNEPMAPASTTKIMTALLTLENCKLNEVVKIKTNPCLAEGSAIGLKEGDEYTVLELLYALLLESANDAAIALAEHISLNETEFAKLMNEKALKLGAKNTHFVNASGLYEDNHYTTPYDLALIMKDFSKHKEFIEICSKVSHEMPASIIDGKTKWVNNRNSLVFPTSKYYYKPIICSKTGYTTKSRHTYVAMAEKDNHRLILTLFDYETKPNYYEDTIKLFNYGFDTFKPIKLYSKGDIVTEFKFNETTNVPLSLKEDIYYVIDKTKSNSTYDLENLKSILKSNFEIISNTAINKLTEIKKNEELFEGILYLEGKSFKTVPLVSEIDLSLKVQNNFLKFIKFNFKYIVFFILFLIVILLFFILFFKNKRKKSKYSRIFNNKNR